jgi:hypothetical protein
MNIVRIGEMALTMEQSIGVILGMAYKNVSWQMKNPRMAAISIFGKSLLSTFSEGLNIEIIQKREPAPTDLKVNSASGDMPLLDRSLLTIMLRPKIR